MAEVFKLDPTIFTEIQEQEQNRREFAVCKNCRFFLDMGCRGKCLRSAPANGPVPTEGQDLVEYGQFNSTPPYYPGAHPYGTCGDFKPDYSRDEVIAEFRERFPRQIPTSEPFPY